MDDIIKGIIEGVNDFIYNGSAPVIYILTGVYMSLPQAFIYFSTNYNSLKAKIKSLEKGKKLEKKLKL